MRRRRFIGTIGALAVMPGIGWTMPRASTRAERFFIYDERYPDARQAALEQEAAGARILATSGEIVTLWRERIAGAMNVASVQIAGLTQHSDFEIVRSLTAVHRLRVMQREHRIGRARSGTLTAWLLGR